MLAYIIVFIISVLFLAIADAVWVLVVSNRLSQGKSGSESEAYSKTSVAQILSGLFVYILITIGIMVFVLPKLLYGDLIPALFFGGLFGFLIYGIYEGTNYFVLDKYSKFLATLDIAWGGVSIAIVSFVSKYLLDKLS